MEGNRKSKRAPYNAHLSIESLYVSGDEKPIKITADIQINDISNSGLGFSTDIELPMDHFFNSKIVIDEQKAFFCVLRIVRVQKIVTGYRIGCEFVGLADLLGGYIKEYVDEVDKT